MNKHIVALPKKLSQNHCLIRQNVVRHESNVTCSLISQDFICYIIFVSNCMSHFIKQHFLVALLHFFVFSQFHFGNYLQQHVHLKRVHTLCMNYGHSIIIFVFIYMRTIPNLFEHYTIVLLSFTFTYLGLLSYLYNRRLLPLWADLVCQPVQRLLYLYTYLYYSNCNIFTYCVIFN